MRGSDGKAGLEITLVLGRLLLNDAFPSFVGTMQDNTKIVSGTKIDIKIVMNFVSTHASLVNFLNYKTYCIAYSLVGKDSSETFLTVASLPKCEPVL